MRSTKNQQIKIPNQRIRSTSELATALNLSRWTVSRVLNGHPGVHPDTVAKVQAAMSASGFAPNPLAQGLRRGRTNMIGVCVPEADQLFLGKKLEHLRQTLDAEGFQIVVGMTNGTGEEEIQTLKHFRASCVAGAVLFASRLPEDHPAITQFGETPLITVDPIGPTDPTTPPPRPRRASPHTLPPLPSLRINRTTGMKQAMEHLFSLGHRQIATLGISGEGAYTQMRLKGINQFLKSKGLIPAEQIRALPLPEAENLYEAGRLSAALYFAPAKRPRPADHPTAILTVNDRVAIGLIEGFRQLGISVPEAFSVIGYDNMEVAPYFFPALTSIDAKPDRLMEQTTTLLLEAMRNEKSTLKTPASGIPSALVIRHSTGPVPAP